MQRQIIIKYEWWRVDREPIDPEHMAVLKELTEEHIFKAIAAGWTEGVLEDRVHIHETDPENGIEYHGGWEWVREE